MDETNGETRSTAVFICTSPRPHTAEPECPLSEALAELKGSRRLAPPLNSATIAAEFILAFFDFGATHRSSS